jgi:L-lactate dehydrogenase complex protein LldG
LNSREIILGRIREALRAPAEQHAAATPNPEWSARIPESLDEQIQLFERNALALKAEFHACASIQDAAVIARSFAWKKIGVHEGDLTNAVARELALPEIRTSQPYAIDELEKCDAGLTECEALVAETGSVLVSTFSAGGRALSVLPPHHVVLARRSQMVPNLAAAFQRLRKKYGEAWPSFLSFITGPSRTGDIERILVLGAHGPKRLTILLLP